MSKLFYKAIIEDIQNNKCTDQEIEKLLDVYASTIKRVATTLARKAWFELSDFHGARESGISGFSLMIERKKLSGTEHFVGAFENGSKSLKVMAVLEKTSL